MNPPELRMLSADLAALQREVAQNLSVGRAFLPEAADVPVLSDCVLVLVHPVHATELRLAAQVVMVSAEGAMKGTGLEMRPWGADQLAQVEAFVRAMPPSAAGEEAAADAEDGSDGEEPLDPEHTQALADGESMPPDAQLDSKQDKLRHLSVNEQLKLARTGELTDRLVVERMYGKQVWDALLHNPRLTIPEVARIARKGTVPKPLLEVILDNGAWIKTPQVRRALLGNPKCGTEAIGKLLRITPKHELKLIEKSTAYSMPVREAARKLVKQLER